MGDPQPQGKTLEQHSALPPGITPSAFANGKIYFSPFTIADYFTYTDDLCLNAMLPGKPHAGKVLATAQAHVDDISLRASGTVAKLDQERGIHRLRD